MYQYELWVKLNDYQTTHTMIWAPDDWAAKQLGEAQYGPGSVLNYTRMPDLGNQRNSSYND